MHDRPPVIGPCGKRVYASEPVALKLARRVNDSGSSSVHPYHCCKCHGWHLGENLARGKYGRRPRIEENTKCESQ